jgi:hypothetical protein
LHAKIDLSTLDSSFLWHCSEHELQQFISICQEFLQIFTLVNIGNLG